MLKSHRKSETGKLLASVVATSYSALSWSGLENKQVKTTRRVTFELLMAIQNGRDEFHRKNLKTVGKFKWIKNFQIGFTIWVLFMVFKRLLT